MRLSLLANKLRWRYGNYWASYYWRRLILAELLKVIYLLLMIFLAYAVVSWNDQRIEAKLQVQAAQEQAAFYQTALLNCLNGKPTGLYSTDAKGNQVHVGCDPAWDLPVGRAL